MSEPRIPLLVLGLGNVLCGDDGLGVAAVEILKQRFQPAPGVTMIDGGTLGLTLLPLLQNSDSAILVDAIRTDLPPGTLLRLEGDDVAPAVRERLSVHQIGVADLLDAAELTGRYPPRLILVGLVPASLELGVALSPAVQRNLASLVAAVAVEVRALGFDLPARQEHDEADDSLGRGPAAALPGSSIA